MTQGNRGDRLLPLSAILAELCQDNGIVEVVLGLGDRLFLGIDHSAIAISNTEQSLKFYRDLLGMQFDGGSFNQGETQARLDCLSEEVEVKITALRPDRGGLGIELLDYVLPPNSRPIPSNWKSSDIANMQIELVVNDIEQTVEMLRQNGVEFVSSRVVKFTEICCPYHQGCLVKDADGHGVLLIAE